MTQIGVGGGMTIEEFKAADGSGLSGSLLALWWDAKGDWVRRMRWRRMLWARMGPGCMLTCIARRGIWGMRGIGIGARGGHFVTCVPVSVGLAATGLALLGLLIPTSGRTDADYRVKSGIRVTK